ncbi:MAG TPA: ABC transporter substrate-binding protein [Actinomycetota bacterium]|nr:ABC transporter substrate-binding protein [Actinomycetota bacterium]
MNTKLRMIALVAVLGLVAAACGGDDDPGQDEETTGAPAENLSGGTLTMAQLADVVSGFDPQKEYYSVTWEYYRCCLLRTLMSYEGVPTEDGGAEIHPDLAAAEPEVSEDQLTWTFTIKPGINYAPPFDDVAITANDFVTALKRTANPKANVGGYSFYYSVIEGFDDYANGDADEISGAVAVDDTTLELTLTEPTGDLGYRFAMATTAPIPPLDGAEFGAAQGHDKTYGRFLVASGPYMFEGSEAMDFSVPVKDQAEVAGYVPGRSIVLVRNPSYDPSTDGLRPAYPDRIEVTIGGDNDDLYNQVAAGEIDFVVDGAVPPDKIREYQTTPDLQDRMNVYPSDAMRYVSFNLAMPPFDDVHVRKAINWAFDKQGFRQQRGGETTGELAGHIFVNSLQNNLLADYDPYATPNGSGDIEAAQEEMAQSKYDSDGDGVCDDPVCEDILTVTDREDPYPKQSALMQQFLEPLGITLDVKQLERGVMYTRCNDMNSQTALCAGPGWGKDYADGYTFGGPMFDSSGLWPSCCNYQGMGASADQLREWGYDVSEVPSIDDQVDECSAATGNERFQCWADFDSQLMEDIVPMVPYLFDNSVDIISANVTNYSFDQFAGLADFGAMAVSGGDAA